MDKKLKAKWVKALRSGEYKQGKDNLRDNQNRFCCLGVLCDIEGRRWFANRYSNKLFNYEISHNGSLDGGGEEDERLRDSVGSYARLAELIQMNDSGKSFEEIADYIEANL